LLSGHRGVRPLKLIRENKAGTIRSGDKMPAGENTAGIDYISAPCIWVTFAILQLDTALP
jgi:hypothetical protein